ncbi:PP2C family protein-serine/threonine phosphatase [Nocardioides flavescens]|uniref:SpoIIE family protein phosphatase n=1 Tax=Nocardioides flavescens TaxID=2691959 RepID=A0A6L7F254_9ACTN|nr:SpoIIE family protein phosphatase [Nocardioides flavescens]MXG91191.1 SpoIIE family protein phosphatase [Nocardioides flavescens]
MAVHTDVRSTRTGREERRQRAVEALGLTENVREERFDRITRLARALFDVDASTVTVLDRDRAIYPGAAGYDGTPLPRQETLCDRATSEESLLVVPDATQDPRFDSLDIVTSGVISFYVGAPLRDGAGNVVGVLCAFDSAAKMPSPTQLKAFEDLAVWAQQELVGHAERRGARQVQTSLLPDRPLELDGWDVAGLCLPALAVGGDFYDYGVSHGVLHLGLGDVMGKGTGAALLGAGVRAAIRATHQEVVAGGDLGRSATRVARGLGADLERSGSFATVFEAAVDLCDGTVRSVDAGLGLVLVVRADGSCERQVGRGRPFGVLPDDTWEQQTFHLEPGDRLVVFSDGLLDLVDDQLRWWEPVGAMVGEAADTASLLAHVSALAAAHTALDDVTVLVVHRHAGAQGAA